MNDVIDFNEAKLRKDTDGHLVLKMPDGSTWFKYSADYTFKSSGSSGVPEEILMNPEGITFLEDTFSIGFWARSDEDAEQRVNAMQESLRLSGRLVSEI